MNANLLPIVLAVAASFGGFFFGYVMTRRIARSRLQEARSLSESMIADAQKSTEKARLKAEAEFKQQSADQREQLEEQMTDRQRRITQIDREIVDKEEIMSRRLDLLDRKDAANGERQRALETKQKVLDERLSESGRLIAEQNVKLERIAGLRKEEAKRLLLKNLEDESRMEASKRAREIRENAERDAQRDSQKILALAIQRYAAEHCIETTAAVVHLPSDDMKGRIIGREGRNIRAFEMATGVDVIIDDTPEAVIISGFDPVRREVARISMQKLIEDGRIHPARIEEIVKKTQGEIETRIWEAGEQACLDLGIHGMETEMVRLVGRMRYRTSYGQNCLAHSVEVAYLSGMIASELNLDPHIARRAGLLHDIGKVATHEQEGSHTEIGAEMAAKYGESEDVINVVRAHHGDVEATCLYTPIVAAADALSGARPGARRESLESYVKRLAKLEEIADAFAGVEKSYAIQAGREVRVIVSHRDVDDEGAAQLAFDISRRFEKELDYPGQIKVVAIREIRATDYAK